MQKKGHEIRIAASKKDILLNLLDAYGFSYNLISSQNNEGFGRIKDQISHEVNLYKVSKKFNPDIITGIGGTAASHVSKITKAKSIIFTDNFLKYDKFITHPWADSIITPTSFSHDLGKKQIKVPSFKELAYLHPTQFNPNYNIYRLMNLKEADRFVIVRFVSFKALHDTNISGFNEADKIRLVNRIREYANVFISSEGELPTQLKKYAIRFPSEKIHDALYFANLLVTDSQTMTTEAAVLGTPAVRCNSWVDSDNEMLNFVELEKKYNLIHNIGRSDVAINKCCEILTNPKSKKMYRKRSEKLISDKINFTDFLVWLFENYFKYDDKSLQKSYIDYYNEHLNKYNLSGVSE